MNRFITTHKTGGVRVRMSEKGMNILRQEAEQGVLAPRKLELLVPDQRAEIEAINKRPSR